jgi:hypothetical protein
MEKNIKIKWTYADFHNGRIALFQRIRSKIQIFWITIRHKYPVAIDFNTLMGVKSGGRLINAMELIDIWHKNRILLYDGTKGNAPVMFKNASRVKIFDINSEEGKKALEELTKQTKG